MIAALGLAGCGRSAPEAARTKKPSESQNPADEPRRQLETRDVTMAQRDEKRVPQWTVTGKKALVNITEDGRFSGTLEGVSGELFANGKSASRFTAERGEADQVRNTLVVSGAVTVIDSKSGTKLVANQMQWLASRKLIEASGNVRVIGNDYEVGPMAKVLATPDLKQFGTPDRFSAPRP